MLFGDVRRELVMLRLLPSLVGLRNALIRNTYTKLHLVYRKQLLFTNRFLLSGRKSQGTASVVGKMIAHTVRFGPGGGHSGDCLGCHP